MDKAHLKSQRNWPEGTIGFAAYTSGLFLAAAMLPATALDPSAQFFLAGIGVLAATAAIAAWQAVAATRAAHATRLALAEAEASRFCHQNSIY